MRKASKTGYNDKYAAGATALEYAKADMTGTLALAKGTGDTLNVWTASGIETTGVTYTFYTTTESSFNPETDGHIAGLTEINNVTGLTVAASTVTIDENYADSGKYLVVKASKTGYNDKYAAGATALEYDGGL